MEGARIDYCTRVLEVSVALNVSRGLQYFISQLDLVDQRDPMLSYILYRAYDLVTSPGMRACMGILYSPLHSYSSCYTLLCA